MTSCLSRIAMSVAREDPLSEHYDRSAEDAYMAAALAEGQHMTEGATAVMQRTIRGLAEVVQGDEAYIETLERAVLKSWFDEEWGTCKQCDGAELGVRSQFFDNRFEYDHATGCIVPALLAKYEPA